MGDMIDRDAVLRLAREVRCGSCGGWIDPDKPYPECCDRPDWREGRDAQELARTIAALPAEPAEDVRAGALREAVEAVNKAREAVIHSGNRAYIDGISVGHDRAERAILALISEAKP